MSYLDNLKNKIKETKREQEKKLAREIYDDFHRRQEERKPFEAQWNLNMNFLMGNQYCTLGRNAEVEEIDRQFFWQEREVFNHIAPLVDVRLAKLSTIRPEMTVVPSSSDEKDVSTAKLSKKILKFIQNSKNFSEVVQEGTKWSEICGTSFYKVSWNKEAGEVFVKTQEGEEINEGDIEISALSPFEIFPENSTCKNLEDCASIILAKCLPVSEIYNKWKVKVEPEELNVFSLDLTAGNGGLGYNGMAKCVTDNTRSDCALLLEKYVLPTPDLPNGRLVIVAGDNVLFDGELPYENGACGKRTYPIIRQTSLENAGCFWGCSIIERVIPIQRAYNAIKNRKHEFLNRISMGVVTVEDGSVDIENLEEEGLSPGKILIYRQGSTPPTFMNSGNVPSDFTIEEDRLLNEFLTISGVSDLMRNSANAANLSGTALELLMEQDDTRLSSTVDQLRHVIRKVAEQSLRLYKQFAIVPKKASLQLEDGVDMFYFLGSQINADDIVFETEQEASQTIAQKRNMIFELLKSGLLQDEEGKLSGRMKAKVLEMLGFGVIEGASDIKELHIKKAKKENIKFLKKEDVKVSEIDEHEMHIQEHTAFMLGSDFDKAQKKDAGLEKRLIEHVRLHKKMKSASTQAEMLQQNKE